MSAAEKLKAVESVHDRVVPLYRKTGPGGSAHSYERARDIEAIMDALPQIRAVVEELEEDHPYDAESHCPQCVVLIALDEALP